MKKFICILLLLVLLSSGVYANNLALDSHGRDFLEEAQTETLSMDNKEISRIFGDNRYKTAIEISKSHWDTSEYVVLSRADEYADALAGTNLAVALEAPLLLTQTSRLNQDTLIEIKRLDTKKVMLLGGESAISENVENALHDEGIKTERIAGPNRYETSIAIAEYVADFRGESSIEKAFLVSGVNFPDALSIAPEAARKGYPILLTNGQRFHQTVENFINEYNVSEITAIGGPSVVNESITEDLGHQRIYGSNRYLSALAVAKAFETGGNSVLVATGLNFPDALSAGVLGALTDQNIILVNARRLSPELETYLSDMELVVIGGENVVPTELFQSPESEDEEDNVYHYLGKEIPRTNMNRPYSLHGYKLTYDYEILESNWTGTRGPRWTPDSTSNLGDTYGNALGLFTEHYYTDTHIELDFALLKKYTTLKGIVGVSDFSKDSSNRVKFEILADDEIIYSEEWDAGMFPEEIELNVESVNKLTIRQEPIGSARFNMYLFDPKLVVK